jgi:hypothetical protein
MDRIFVREKLGMRVLCASRKLNRLVGDVVDVVVVSIVVVIVCGVLDVFVSVVGDLRVFGLKSRYFFVIEEKLKGVT